jgi:hypothetical protein
LNLPKTNESKVLAEIQADPGLRRIPVVVLTTSEAEPGVPRSDDLFANGYITKPVELDQFLQVVKSINDFWLTVVRLPSDLRIEPASTPIEFCWLRTTPPTRDCLAKLQPTRRTQRSRLFASTA